MNTVQDQVIRRPPPGSSKPDHVPEHLVYDVDFFNLIVGSEDAQEAWRRLQQDLPDIFWTPRYVGHWVATRAEDIKTIQLDHEHFSHSGNNPARLTDELNAMLNMDPPEHTPYRRLITPAFLPKAVTNLEKHARDVAIQLIEKLAPRGECEFISEFAKVLPIVVFLAMVDLPLEDREMFLPWAEDAVRSPFPERQMAARQKMAAYLGKYIDERTANPGEDLISTVAKGRIGDRPITRKEIVSTCVLLLFGGLDTVASILGFIARFLAQNPEHRHRIIEDPAIITVAVEELIRRHGLPNTFRELTQDYLYKGVLLKKGDYIQIPNSLFGLDERLVADPLKVDFDRERPIPHAAFGNGPHTCPGAVLARREIRVFLEEWLKRIPDFQIKPGTQPVIATGLVNGVLELKLSWDPATVHI
jgi:cytochrome P450